jgi:hypothetical protein
MVWTARSPVAHAVYAAGFQYDAAQDIITSRLDAWIQSRAGFCWAIDIIGPVALMIIDCETFYFHWDNRLWLIELWKGQYGLETGCEIGVYQRPFHKDVLEPPSETIKHIHRNRTLRFASSTHDLLYMSSRLYREGSLFFTRGPERHWWLTGFKWGVFSQPSQLSMDAVINFPSKGMCDQFKAALTATGYAYVGSDRHVSFKFDHPRTPQPRSRGPLDRPAQRANANLVVAYNILKAELGNKTNDPNDIVMPPEWANKIAHAVEHVAHGAAAAANILHQGAAAAAARLHGRAAAAASTVTQAAVIGAQSVESRIVAARKAYGDVLTFFQAPRAG